MQRPLVDWVQHSELKGWRSFFRSRPRAIARTTFRLQVISRIDLRERFGRHAGALVGGSCGLRGEEIA
jgi:hypothetical protein